MRLRMFFLAAALLWVSVPLPTSEAQDSVSVQEFVRRLYFEGVPYLEATKYGPEAVPILLRMLSDSTEQPYWSNIVTTLGMIGRRDVVDSLISFIHSGGQTRLPPHIYTAKTSAIMALGYIANKNQGGAGLGYLLQSVGANSWAGRVQWLSPFHSSANDRDTQLVAVTTLGLALSGRPEADATLRSLRQPAPNAVEKVLRDRVAPTVNIALRDHAVIARDGLASYYARRVR